MLCEVYCFLLYESHSVYHNYGDVYTRCNGTVTTHMGVSASYLHPHVC